MRHAKIDDAATFHLLRTIPGIGKILGLILLYEIDDIAPFPRGRQLPLLRPPGALRARNGRQEEGRRRQEDRQRPSEVGLRRGRLSLMLRSFPAAKAWMQRQERKRSQVRAHAILEAKIGRAVYALWRKQHAVRPEAVPGVVNENAKPEDGDERKDHARTAGPTRGA